MSRFGTTSETPLPLRVGAKTKTCSGPSWRRIRPFLPGHCPRMRPFSAKSPASFASRSVAHCAEPCRSDCGLSRRITTATTMATTAAAAPVATPRTWNPDLQNSRASGRRSEAPSPDDDVEGREERPQRPGEGSRAEHGDDRREQPRALRNEEQQRRTPQRPRHDVQQLLAAGERGEPRAPERRVEPEPQRCVLRHRPGDAARQHRSPPRGRERRRPWP